MQIRKISMNKNKMPVCGWSALHTKKMLLMFLLFAGTAFLSGCSFKPSTTLTNKNTMTNATVLKTEDGGVSWNPKIKVDDKKNISGVDVLSMAISPLDSNVIYLGSAANGLFQTKDAGETWKQVAFPDKAYGLLFDPNDANIMYASGVFNGRAKIFKRIGEDQEWKDIYTEPADGTIISTLAIDNKNHQVLFAGTNAGVIIKSTDAGATWLNLQKAEGPINSIAFDSANSAHIFFGVYKKGLLETKDGGTTLEENVEKIDSAGRIKDVYTLIADPYLGGVFYVGTGKGMFRRANDGSWSEINIIESSKAFPIRAIAVNPANSKEIMYAASKAIYKTIDNGVKWSTFQLEASKEISVLKYVNNDSSKIYAGLRSF